METMGIDPITSNRFRDLVTQVQSYVNIQSKFAKKWYIYLESRSRDVSSREGFRERRRRKREKKKSERTCGGGGRERRERRREKREKSKTQLGA